MIKLTSSFLRLHNDWYLFQLCPPHFPSKYKGQVSTLKIGGLTLEPSVFLKVSHGPNLLYVPPHCDRASSVLQVDTFALNSWLYHELQGTGANLTTSAYGSTHKFLFLCKQDTDITPLTGLYMQPYIHKTLATVPRDTVAFVWMRHLPLLIHH